MPPDWRLTSQKIKLTENHVEQACLDLLQHHHYWPVRQHAGRLIAPDECVLRVLRETSTPYRWITVGATGLPDWALIHPERPGFLMEVKRPGGKLNRQQEAKHLELKLWPLEIVVIDGVEELLAWLNEHEKH